MAKVDHNQGCNLMNQMSRGVKIEADHFFDEKLLEENVFDAIVLPGGLGGANVFKECPLLVQTTEKFLKDETKIVGAICASPAVVLQSHNLLENYDQYTSYPAPVFKEMMDKQKWTD